MSMLLQAPLTCPSMFPQNQVISGQSVTVNVCGAQDPGAFIQYLELNLDGSVVSSQTYSGTNPTETLAWPWTIQ